MNYNKRLIKNFSNCCQDSLMGGVLHDPPPFPFFPLPYLLLENIFFFLPYNPLLQTLQTDEAQFGRKVGMEVGAYSVSGDGAKVKELRTEPLAS